MFQWLVRLFGRGKPARLTSASTAAEIKDSAEPLPVENEPVADHHALPEEGVAFLSAMLTTDTPATDLHQFSMEDREFVSDNLRRVRQNRVEIPILPSTLVRIQQLIANPDARVAEIANIFKDDATLSAELLRLANSSYIAYLYPTLDLQQAIVRVGFTQLHGLVIMFSIRSRVLQGNRYKDEVLWVTELSLAMAKVCQLLAKHMRIPPEEAFTLGLMHNIEHLVIIGEACRMSASRHGKTVSRGAIIETVSLIGSQLHGLIMNSWGMNSFDSYYRAVSGEPDNRPDTQDNDRSDIVLKRLSRLQQILVEIMGGGAPEITIDGFDDQILRNAINAVIINPHAHT
jgi:hypothetical protein